MSESIRHAYGAGMSSAIVTTTMVAKDANRALFTALRYVTAIRTKAEAEEMLADFRAKNDARNARVLELLVEFWQEPEDGKQWLRTSDEEIRNFELRLNEVICRESHYRIMHGLEPDRPRFLYLGKKQKALWDAMIWSRPFWKSKVREEEGEQKSFYMEVEVIFVDKADHVSVGV